jgi:hypothetical protein
MLPTRCPPVIQLGPQYEGDLVGLDSKLDLASRLSRFNGCNICDVTDDCHLDCDYFHSSTSAPPHWNLCGWALVV